MAAMEKQPSAARRATSTEELALKALENVKVKVSVEGRDGAFLAAVTLRLGATVRDVIFSIIRQVGPCGRLRLHFDGRELAEEETFTSLGVRDNLTLVADVCAAVVTASEDLTARVWNAEVGRCELILEGHTKPVCFAAFAPNFRSVVTASEDKTAKLWGMDTGNCAQTLEGHKDTVYSASFSPDCRHVVTTSSDGTARIYVSKTGECKQVLEGHSCPVFSASFSDDGKHVTTNAQDGSIKMWNVKSGAVERTLQGQAPTYSASFSEDGSKFVTPSGDNAASICNAETGEVESTLVGHSGLVLAASFAVPPKVAVGEVLF